MTSTVSSSLLDGPAATAGTRRKIATLAMMTALVVSAFEGTVPTTAMPSIVRELGGTHLFSWVYASFLVASAVSIPVFSKLADRAGRRPIFTAGMTLFLLGSVLCGAAHSMHELIAARTLQGLGVGAIGPLVPTVIGDLYTLEERARVQALFMAAWGAANAAGPVIGGLIVSSVSWRWVFYVNVPFGVAAVALLLASYVDPPGRAASSANVRSWHELSAFVKTNLDVRGTILFALAASAMLLGLEDQAAFGHAVRVALLAMAGVFAVMLVREERSLRDDAGTPPLLPFAELADPVVRAGAIGSLFAGGLMYAIPAYVPFWFATERHESAVLAGVALIPFLVAWAVGSALGVKLLVRLGAVAVSRAAISLSGVGTLLVALAARMHAPTWCVFAALGIVGLGLGATANSTLVGPQSRVPWAKRGAVTGFMQVGRTLGGATIVALLALLPSAQGRFLVLALLALAGGRAITFAASWNRAGDPVPRA
ncbi:MFS transporter [Pendulispora rubella]|uniref:MFS transporter n=1 Tax=Pendulispora rubella TaxID=2741070 RepID=A0ABZ2L556_9BACT